jgi:ribulose 1,5-bisphosphate synthetase/thiazole synthase
MSYRKLLLATISIMALLPSVVLGESHPEELEADVVVYGATSGGISAAAAAAREGKSVLLVEHLSFLGGLLGAGFNMHQDVPFREPLGGMTVLANTQVIISASRNPEPLLKKC